MATDTRNRMIQGSRSSAPRWRYRRCGLGLALVGLTIAGCRPPDGTALRKLACEEAAASFDLQSISQMDALRKALGVAPDVDPIGACKALGADMTPRAQDREGAESN